MDFLSLTQAADSTQGSDYIAILFIFFLVSWDNIWKSKMFNPTEDLDTNYAKEES